MMRLFIIFLFFFSAPQPPFRSHTCIVVEFSTDRNAEPGYAVSEDYGGKNNSKTWPRSKSPSWILLPVSHTFLQHSKMDLNSRFLAVAFPRATATGRIRILMVYVSVAELCGVATAVIGPIALDTRESRLEKGQNMSSRAQFMRPRKSFLSVTMPTSL